MPSNCRSARKFDRSGSTHKRTLQIPEPLAGTGHSFRHRFWLELAVSCLAVFGLGFRQSGRSTCRHAVAFPARVNAYPSFPTAPAHVSSVTNRKPALKLMPPPGRCQRRDRSFVPSTMRSAREARYRTFGAHGGHARSICEPEIRLAKLLHCRDNPGSRGSAREKVRRETPRTRTGIDSPGTAGRLPQPQPDQPLSGRVLRSFHVRGYVRKCRAELVAQPLHRRDRGHCDQCRDQPVLDRSRTPDVLHQCTHFGVLVHDSRRSQAGV